MGFQTAEVSERLVSVYKLPLTPDEYTALTRTQEHVDLMRDANLLPGNLFTMNFTNNFPVFFSLSIFLHDKYIRIYNYIVIVRKMCSKIPSNTAF